MILYVVGDLFESPAKVLVNPVNTAGVMGAGLSAEFKRFYPQMFEQYAALCRDQKFTIGSLWLYRTPHKWVLNFPVREHYRSPVQPDHLEQGLQKFAAIYADQGITSASFPMIGTDAGLNWETEVRPLMEAYLNPLPIAIYIHRGDVDNPFPVERGSMRGVRAWLEGQPKIMEFPTFWRDLNRMIKYKTEFTTLLDKTRFRVGIDNSRKALVILTGLPQPMFLSQMMLNELWVYLRSAGYALPHNLPNGLDEGAKYIFSLLADLDYLRPIYAGTKDGEWMMGLQYVPPVDRTPAAQKVVVRDADILPDVLAPRLKVVFCGTAASPASSAAGAYYAGPGNRFWETLYRTGLTPRQYAPEEFRELTQYGIGLTDLAKLASGPDSAIPRDCFDAAGLLARIEQHKPQVVAFTSKRAAQEYYGAGVQIEYGWQPQGVGPAKAFVLPSPSGAARGYWDESYWRQLAEYVKSV